MLNFKMNFIAGLVVGMSLVFLAVAGDGSPVDMAQKRQALASQEAQNG